MLSQTYVARGNDITTPEQVLAALIANPLRNTIVSLIDFDIQRLAELNKVMVACAVAGSASIRFAQPCADGLLVGRHSIVGGTGLIGQAFIDRALSRLSDNSATSDTLTGVSWSGQAAPASVTLSRVWKPKRTGVDTVDGDEPAGDVDSLPFSVVSSPMTDVEFLRCHGCERLFVHIHHYAAHTCTPPREAQTLMARTCAAAVDRSLYTAPLPVVALPYAANAHTVRRLGPGWAKCLPRNVEKLDDAVVQLLTRWFNDGEASGKTKCSAPAAVRQLLEHRTVDGLPLFDDEDDVPTEARIKRFFSKLARDKKRGV